MRAFVGVYTALDSVFSLGGQGSSRIRSTARLFRSVKIGCAWKLWSTRQTLSITIYFQLLPAYFNPLHPAADLMAYKPRDAANDSGNQTTRMNCSQFISIPALS